MKKAWLIFCAFLLVLGLAANGYAINISAEPDDVLLVGYEEPTPDIPPQDFAEWVNEQINAYNASYDPDLPLVTDPYVETNVENLSSLTLTTEMLAYEYISFKAAKNLYLYYLGNVTPPPSGSWVFGDPNLSHYRLWNPKSHSVTEPSTILLLGLSMVGLAGIGRKKLKR
jgi:hypothetical protein